MSERGRGRLRQRGAAVMADGALLDRAGQWRDQAMSTPGRLVAIGLVLVVLVLGAGAATGLTVHARDGRIDTLRASADPLANAAQDLYASLSIADASAATAFLAGGLQPQAMVDRYNSAVATASAALSTATIGVSPSDETAQELLSAMSSNLPVYTGLIATAGANNRAGNPVGVNYLGEASHLMQTEILPRAERLYAEQSAAVSRLENRNASVDWLPLLVSAAALVALVCFQVYLARRSNRRFNPGLVIASAAMAVMFVWILAAGLVASSFSKRAAHESTGPLTVVTTARITAQQARTDETRNLLARGDNSDLPRSFDERMTRVEAALAPGSGAGAEHTEHGSLADARNMLDAWRHSHSVMRDHLAVGDYPGAVQVAIGSAPDSSATSFARLDTALEYRIAHLRASGGRLTDQSADATAFLVVGTGILAGIAALGVILGLWPRLSEYQ